MKKKHSVQSQIAALAFVLSFVLLNAAQENVIRREDSQASHQTPSPKLPRLTEAEVISKLAGRLAPFDKLKIEGAIKMVHPDRYTDAFVEVVRQLLRSNVFYNANVIIAAGKVAPDRYADFIKVVNELLQMEGRYLDSAELDAIAKISPDFYPKLVHVIRKFARYDHFKSGIIESVAKVSPNDYDIFVDRVDNIVTEIAIQDAMRSTAQIYLGYKYEIIHSISKIHSDHFEAFKYTVNCLAQDGSAFEKMSVIKALAHVYPDCYTDDFIETVKELLEGVDISEIGGVIVAAGMVDPNSRADFVNMINQIADKTNKAKVIRALARVSPDLYIPVQNLIKSYFQYFIYVHPDTLQQMIRPNMNQGEVEGVIRSLYEKNYRPMRPLISKGPASISKKLKPVFDYIQACVEGHVLSYERVLELLDKEMEKIKKDRLAARQSDIFDKVYGWVIKNNSRVDKMVIAPVVTYLYERDSYQGIENWLYTLMKESFEAYYQGSLNQASCMDGLSERAIASLRSAIPEDDDFLENFFREYSKT